MLNSLYDFLNSNYMVGRLWLYEVVAVLVVTVFCVVIVPRMVARLQVAAKSTEAVWDDALFDALVKPAIWMSWLLGVSFAVNTIVIHVVPDSVVPVGLLARILGVFILVWFVNGFVSRIETSVINGRYNADSIDKSTALALGKLLRISIIISACLITLQLFDYSITGLLAFGGIGGVVIGFASKDLLANFFGGLMIFLDRPFAVGDWVRSPDQNIEGVVEHVGWRLTRIRTFDKRPLYVPNSTFTHISVENPSRMSHRRIYETIGVRYDDSHAVAAIVADVKKMLEHHDEIDINNTLIVNFNSFGPSSLDFFIYCLTKTVDWTKYHEVKQDVLLRILKIIDNHGAECAFPTSTIHLADSNSPLNIDSLVHEGAD